MGQLPALQVLHQVLQPGHQARALGLHGAFQCNRIGKGRICRAHGLNDAAQGKAHFRFIMFGQAIQLIGCCQHIFGHDLIALTDQVEYRMLPLRRGKTAVGRIDLVPASFGQRFQHRSPGIQGRTIGL